MTQQDRATPPKPLMAGIDAALKALRFETNRVEAGKALVRAIALGNAERVQTALDNGAVVTDTGADGNTPLHQAAKDGETAIMKILLQQAPFIDVKNKQGLTPLCLAVCGNHAEITEDLIEAGANVNYALPVILETPLMMAVYRNHHVIAARLIRHGAKVDLRDVNGVTAFMRAAGQNYTGCLKILAGNGADPQLTSLSGRTAQDYAQRSRAQESLEFIESYVAERAAGALAYG